MEFRDVPIVFFNYNRLDCTRLVASRIQEWAPKKLYIFADGAKSENVSSEVLKVQEFLKNADWPSQVFMNFSERNLGCKQAIETGLDQVFSKERYAIILEDDTVPHSSFFSFVARLLIKYEQNTNIGVVAGFNYVGQVDFTDKNYFASNLLPIWGWGTWSRIWREHRNFTQTPTHKSLRDTFAKRFPVFATKALASETFRAFTEGHTWDYPLLYSLTHLNMLSIVPSRNLIENVGFDHRATHTLSKPVFGDTPALKAGDASDPDRLIPNTQYEKQVLKVLFSKPSDSEPITKHWRLPKIRLLEVWINCITRGRLDQLGNPKPKQRILLFGAGAGGSNVYRLLRNRYEIVGFVDNSKTGHHPCGKPIFSPEMIVNMKFHLMIIASQYSQEILVQCIGKLNIPKEKIVIPSTATIKGRYNFRKQ